MKNPGRGAGLEELWAQDLVSPEKRGEKTSHTVPAQGYKKGRGRAAGKRKRHLEQGTMKQRPFINRGERKKTRKKRIHVIDCRTGEKKQKSPTLRGGKGSSDHLTRDWGR